MTKKYYGLGSIFEANSHINFTGTYIIVEHPEPESKLHIYRIFDLQHCKIRPYIFYGTEKFLYEGE